MYVVKFSNILLKDFLVEICVEANADVANYFKGFLQFFVTVKSLKPLHSF